MITNNESNKHNKISIKIDDLHDIFAFITFCSNYNEGIRFTATKTTCKL